MEPQKRRRRPRTKPASPRTLPAVLLAAEAGGWAHSVRSDNDTANDFPPEAIPRTEATFVRNDEEIIIVYWQNVETAEERPTYTIGTRHVKLRNVSAAKKQLLTPVEEAEKNRVRRVRGKAKKFEEAANPQKRVPFDVSEVTEEEMKTHMGGRRIRWWSSTKDSYEEATVMKNPKKFKLEQNKEGKRILTFCDARGGFRTIYLERLMTVEGTGRR